jgi:hypothetical protein
VLVIKARLQNGVIVPLEPLPAEWSDGTPLSVSAAGAEKGPEGFEEWARELERLAASLDDPEDWARFDAAIAEADEADKTIVRREMGLP